MKRHYPIYGLEYPNDIFDLDGAEFLSHMSESVEVYLHPNYDPETFENDIALIRPKLTLTWETPTSSPCLTPHGTERSKTLAVTISGWGSICSGN